MKTINVTEPFLPPLDEYIGYLKGIWERNWLTNNGPLVQELEMRLQQCHGLSQPFYCVANGGLGLQIILKALGIKGEVITTPFSYVATTSCPMWEGCSVKFADIEPDNLTLDPKTVEAAITPRTEAILATHVYGNPCDVEGLQVVASKHGLALIYDAAHAFGVSYKGKSILDFGDASMVSMHATKVFHSVEGGFITAREPAVAEKMEWMRRFGHNGYGAYHGVGINAKMSEFHAAMGLSNFKYLEKLISVRKKICEIYDFQLSCLNYCKALQIRDHTTWNYAYYPIFFSSEDILIKIEKRLNGQNIFPRRYFYPSMEKISELGMFDVMPISQYASERVMCLPLSHGLQESEVFRICREFEL